MTVDVFNFNNYGRGDTGNFTVRSGDNIRSATIVYEGVSTSENSSERLSSETSRIIADGRNGAENSQWSPNLFVSDVLPSPYNMSDITSVEVDHIAVHYFYYDGTYDRSFSSTRTVDYSDYNSGFSTQVGSNTSPGQVLHKRGRTHGGGQTYITNVRAQRPEDSPRYGAAQTRLRVFYRGDLRNPRIAIGGSTIGAYTGTLEDGETVEQLLDSNAMSQGSNSFTFQPSDNNGRSNIRIEIEYYDEIQLPSNLQPDNGTRVDVASRVTFSWSHNYDLSQTGYEIRWRYVGDSDWNAVSENTSTTNHVFSAGFFEVGEVEWQVRTRSSGGAESPWSNTANINVGIYPNTPVFTTDSSYPIANPVVSWESSNQVAYEFILYSESGEELWSVTRDSQEQSLGIEYDLENDTYYELHISVRNENGSWSGYGITTVYIDFTEPVNTEIVVVPNSQQAYVYIQVISPEPEGTEPEVIYNEVFRREPSKSWTMILEDMSPSFSYRDYGIASGKVYEYRIRSHADNGTFTDTHFTPESLNLRGIWLHDPDNPQATTVHFPTFERGRRSERMNMGELMQFEGRPLPMMDGADRSERIISVVAQVRSQDVLEKYLDLADSNKTLLYRDKRGRKMYCVLQNIVDEDTFWGSLVPLELMEVYYDEGV